MPTWFVVVPILVLAGLGVRARCLQFGSGARGSSLQNRRLPLLTASKCILTRVDGCALRLGLIGQSAEGR